jgi:hypothetical protein
MLGHSHLGNACAFFHEANKHVCVFIFAKRTLALKETLSNTKHLNKNEILEMPFPCIDGAPPLSLLPEPA